MMPKNLTMRRSLCLSADLRDLSLGCKLWPTGCDPTASQWVCPCGTLWRTPRPMASLWSGTSYLEENTDIDTFPVCRKSLLEAFSSSVKCCVTSSEIHFNWVVNTQSRLEVVVGHSSRRRWRRPLIIPQWGNERCIPSFHHWPQTQSSCHHWLEMFKAQGKNMAVHHQCDDGQGRNYTSITQHQHPKILLSMSGVPKKDKKASSRQKRNADILFVSNNDTTLPCRQVIPSWFTAISVWAELFRTLNGDSLWSSLEGHPWSSFIHWTSRRSCTNSVVIVVNAFRLAAWS